MRPRWRPRPLPVNVRTVRTQAKYESKPRQTYDGAGHKFGSLTPRQLVQYLDEFVVGQENAKKVLSVAVYNHYNRVRANLSAFSPPDDYDEKSNAQPITLMPHPHRTGFSSQMNRPTMSPPSEKSNVLMIGPTGSGKTLLTRTLAKVLDVPFSVSDATAFTQAGYVGEDVDMCIFRLLQAANWDVHRASYGIVYIDEVDKLSKRSTGSTSDGSKDVGGEGVQQALLRMMEGGVVTVQAKGSVMEGPSQSQTPSSMSTIPNVTTAGDVRRARPSLSSGPSHDLYQIDTTNILFIFSGAFVGLENVIRQRLAKGSIGFTANLVNGYSDSHVPFFTSNGKRTPHDLQLMEPADLIKYGFIPEFVSRLPTITTLLPLEIADLFRILTEVNGSLVSQYTSLFGYSGVEIRFTSPALREICRKAYERGGGARGLRAVMEHLLLDAMYEVPGSGIRYVLINESVARGTDSALYWSRGEGGAFWAAWAEEESKENTA